MKVKAITIILTAFMLSCITRNQYTQRTYSQIDEKADEPISISYRVPVVKPTANTENSQEKGGVVISVEVLPFDVHRTIESKQVAVPQDPNKKGYDRFEIQQTPKYNVDEGNIEFKIRIRNNEQSPLNLNAVGFALIIDGTQWAFPDEQTEEWNKGMIMTGFEREFIVKGPDIKSLDNAQVVYLFLNGVPTKYNSGGTKIIQKSNFEWYYECSIEEMKKEELITYTYESKRIRTEQCTSCSGSGKNPKASVCGRCEGNGQYVGILGSPVKCSKCSGSGKIYPTCSPCSGNGQISYPESRSPSVAKSVSWYGWNVKIVSMPAGAKVSGCDPQTGEIVTSPVVAPYVGAWYRNADEECPIILEMDGKKVSVLPMREDGSPIPKIVVDFTGEFPVVVYGLDVTDK